MIELKVIEKFMEGNGLEPYDVFYADGEIEKYNPLYFNEGLELRSMYLDYKDDDSRVCMIYLHRLLTGKDHVKRKRVEKDNSEAVVKEKRNLLCKVSVKGFVMTDKELGCLRRACNLASHVAIENEDREIYRKLNEYLITGERS